MAVLLLQERSVSGLPLLRHGGDVAVPHPPEGPKQHRPSGTRKPGAQALGGIVFAYLVTVLDKDITLVEALVHEHGGHGGLVVAVDDGPVYRGSPPVAGQYRGMEVHRPPLWNGKHFRRNNPSIGHNDKILGIIASELLHELRVLHLRWLQYLKAQFQGGLLDDRIVELLAPSGGLVRPGHHCPYVLAGIDKALERWDREVWGAEKND
jgi:hypothetical protein